VLRSRRDNHKFITMDCLKLCSTTISTKCKSRQQTSLVSSKKMSFIFMLPVIVFLTLSIFPDQTQACGLDACSREYANLIVSQSRSSRARPRPDPNAQDDRNNEYCNLMQNYHQCLRALSKSCRGNLEYHSLFSLVRQWLDQYSCSQNGTVITSRQRSQNKDNQNNLRARPNNQRLRQQQRSNRRRQRQNHQHDQNRRIDSNNEESQNPQSKSEVKPDMKKSFSSVSSCIRPISTTFTLMVVIFSLIIMC